MRQVTTIEFKQLIRRGVDLFNLRFIQFPFCILFLYFIFVFISEGGTLPSTNTISKPINELEKMLDTNKDTTGKTSIHFYGQFITESPTWTIYLTSLSSNKLLRSGLV